MTQGIHECLDGAIPPSALSDLERWRYDKVVPLLEETVAVLRHSPVPDVTTTVMQRIRELEVESTEARTTKPKNEIRPAAWLRTVFEWIWAPRSIRLRPAWVFAGLALVAVGTGLRPLETSESAGTGVAIYSEGTPTAAEASGATTAGGLTAAQEPVLYVRFELESSGASSVTLTGSFTDWEPRYELMETRPGHWTALVPLEPGVHDYAFVVDGERWVADPDAMRVNDGFGGMNSRVALLAPDPVRPETERTS